MGTTHGMLRIDSDISNYLTAKEVAQRTGIHPRTLDRRLHEGVLTVYVDPRNRHRRLIHIDDVATLTEINPR